jgi:integrase
LRPHAAHQKILPACPRFPAVKFPKKKPAPVSAETFERLLGKADDCELRTFLVCGWLAGLRLSEAKSLEWELSTEAPWVDFDRNRIWFPAEFVKAAEHQWVPLDPVLRTALEALPRHGRKVFGFVSRRTREQLKRSGLSRRVVDLAKRAGVRLTMHALPRGFGCRYAGKVPAQVLQRLMRHANIRTTVDYYANVDAAVEAAVLGPQRNISRNTATTPGSNLSDTLSTSP